MSQQVALLSIKSHSNLKCKVSKKFMVWKLLNLCHLWCSMTGLSPYLTWIVVPPPELQSKFTETISYAKKSLNRAQRCSRVTQKPSLFASNLECKFVSELDNSHQMTAACTQYRESRRNFNFENYQRSKEWRAALERWLTLNLEIVIESQTMGFH